MKNSVNVYNEDGEEVAAIYSVMRDGDKLVVDGKALGTISMDMILTTEQFLKGVRMVFCWPVISFIFLLPYFSIRNIISRRKK